MKIEYKRTSAFTLIELLMVIAIIGVLASILIPAVGSVRKQANIAASKAQLSNYVNAIELFKGEYKYYPDFGQGRTGTESFEVSLDGADNSANFIIGLTGRATDGNALGASAETFGNRRRISFYSFTANEFLGGDAAGSSYQLADRFDNTKISLVIDNDGDGIVEPSLAGAPSEVRASVTAYVAAGDNGEPEYHLWDD